MKILVMYTGGTIGSTESNGYIGPGEGSNDLLLSFYRERKDALFPKKAGDGMDSGGEVEFIRMQPFAVLSENSNGDFLRRLAESVQGALEEAGRQKADGMIVTHGTDTLAYSAAMLGYVFADSSLPIVLVSSNYVLQHPEANGVDNFAHALRFISAGPQGGVYVSYRNTGEEPLIHLGTRLLGHQAYSDAVHSMGQPVETGILQAAGQRLGGVERNDSGQPAEERRERKIHLQAKFQSEAPVLQIYSFPGMPYPQIPDGIRAVLHHSYHAGTICSEGQGIEAFFQEAEKRRIPVFLCGADPGMRYESMRIYKQYKIHVLPVASPISMYMKLWLLLENGLDPREWMDKNIAGEIVE